MGLALLLALQSSVAQPGPSAFAPDPPGGFDVDVSVAGGCEADGEAEIVVCGQRDRNGRYRLPERSIEFEPKQPRAEIAIGGNATARVFIESVEMPGGQVSKRIMVGFKVPL